MTYEETPYGPSYYQPPTPTTTPTTTQPPTVARTTPKTWLGKLFGELYSADTKLEKQGWRDAVDAVFPDFFPFVELQGFLFTIIDWIFNAKIDREYNKGVEVGDQTYTEIFGKVEDAKTILTDYVNGKKAEIDTAINQAKATINAVRDDVATVRANLRTAQDDLNGLLAQMQDAQSQLANHTDNIRDLYQRVKDLEGEARKNAPLLDQVLRRVGI